MKSSGNGVTRREFVAGGASVLLGAGLPGAFAAPLERTRTLHIIGHSHIDAAWLWPWTDSSDVVLTTFRSALDRMNETPGFCYSHSSMSHYEWVQKADPAMFAEIRGRIKEGRWEVVGGWPVEPDCNIPSTESFARHCLYGKVYAAQQLGVDVTVGFNPDSFGHAAGLPTILKHAGYKYYVFLRPQEQEGNYPRLFWWEGPDGSRVLAYRIYGSYDWLADHLADSAAQAFPEGSEDGAFFLGVGDHGGAVTQEQLKKISAAMQGGFTPRLEWSTVGRFFAALERTLPAGSIPVVRGELQHHSRGCYSACGEEKYQNRRAEHELFRTESVASAAMLGSAQEYPAQLLSGAWERVLFNQFHDVLAGTSLYADYQNARDGIGYACQLALENRTMHMLQMAKAVDLRDVPEGAVFAYNPLPWARKCPLEFPYATNTTTERFDGLKAEDGAMTPLQMRPSESMTNFYPRLSAWVDLPACGYKVFTIEREGPAAVPPTRSTAVASNAFGLTSLKAQDGTELLAGPMGLVVFEDKSDTWAHGVDAFRDELGRPRFVSSEVIEDGPVLRMTRQRLTWRSSDIAVEVTEFTATDVVELRFVIHWQEHEQILKLEVPARFTAPKVFAKVPGAAPERAATGNEEPYQDWVALQGAAGGGQYTLALANNSTYSYDCKDNLLSTILIRSAPYARHNPNKVDEGGTEAWQDQGRQERKFWLIRGKGAYTELALDRQAAALQAPAEYVLDSRHGGAEPRERSFLEVSPDTVEVLALKRAEWGRELVVRVQERSGKQTEARVRSSLLAMDEKLSLAPWELKTVSIDVQNRTSHRMRTLSILEAAPTRE